MVRERRGTIGAVPISRTSKIRCKISYSVLLCYLFPLVFDAPCQSRRSFSSSSFSLFYIASPPSDVTNMAASSLAATPCLFLWRSPGMLKGRESCPSAALIHGNITSRVCRVLRIAHKLPFATHLHTLVYSNRQPGVRPAVVQDRLGRGTGCRTGGPMGVNAMRCPYEYVLIRYVSRRAYRTTFLVLPPPQKSGETVGNTCGNKLLGWHPIFILLCTMIQDTKHLFLDRGQLQCTQCTRATRRRGPPARPVSRGGARPPRGSCCPAPPGRSARPP